MDRATCLLKRRQAQTEQEFWLRSAGRWEAILQIKTTKRPTLKAVHLSGLAPSGLASSDDQDIAAAFRFSSVAVRQQWK